MNHSMKNSCVIVLATACAITTHAATLLVANNGSDSVSCGTPGHPCRSISRAIANAAPGDTISVGPGLYGDLNGNGTFTDAGDEAAEVGIGCFCMIKVDKPLKILSQNGADATVLDAGDVNLSAVGIETNGVTFGGSKKGFTITHSANGVELDSANHVTISGNRVMSNKFQGVFLDGSSSFNAIVGNVAVANGDFGFYALGPTNTLKGNVSSANGVGGFLLGGTGGHVMTQNVATDNKGFGVEISADSANCHDNSFIGNIGGGVSAGSGSPSIKHNNIFGNSGCSIDGGGAAPDNFFGGPATLCNGASTPTVATKLIKVKPIAP